MRPGHAMLVHRDHVSVPSRQLSFLTGSQAGVPAVAPIRKAAGTASGSASGRPTASQAAGTGVIPHGICGLWRGFHQLFINSERNFRNCLWVLQHRARRLITCLRLPSLRVIVAGCGPSAPGRLHAAARSES